MQLNLVPLIAPSPADGAVEMVERKGTGHPDTICDALAEELSQALCRFYLDRFGFILHHNVDKVLLWGGETRPAFGGGEVLQPMEIFLAGRATREANGTTVPIEALATESCRNWLRQHFRTLDPDKHVKIHCLIRPGSADLVELYQRQRASGISLANDTSCGVGYAPLDALETVVYEVERHLNAAATKAAHPEIGEDIKVMGVRQGGRIALTVACAFIDRYVTDVDDYVHKKARVAQLSLEAAGQATDCEVEVEVNTADDVAGGSLYLTVTGTSAEAGDDGQVGRGNRANGLITPYRPMNMEAAAGKNPVTHVGKLYNIIATRIAQAVVQEVADISEAACYLVSRIGRPVQEPQVIDLHLRLREGVSLKAARPHVEPVVRDQLSNLGGLWRDVIAGTLKVY